MNQENFAEFLTDPSNLYKITYEELKSLVVQYPYSYPLRLLLLQKSQMENHPDFERNLRFAAIYAPDRKVLFDILQKPTWLSVQEPGLAHHEEVLELKNLTELGILVAQNPEPDSPAVKKQAEVPQAPTKNQAETTETDTHHNFELELAKVEPRISAEQAPTIPPTGEPAPTGNTTFENKEPDTREGVEQTIVGQELISQLAGNPSQPTPTPKSNFPSWQNHLKKTGLGQKFALANPAISDESRAILKSRAHTVRRESELIAEQSLMDNDEIISETLAAVLIAQGQNTKAIQMYERLILKFPEKRVFFATRIENLKIK
jgi:hypothetical protein